jgi:UDP:flavonoid glycosyltransferase YjiC (YdhE family)
VSRFLIVVPPFTGHINPIAGVAEELRARGHQVAWVGDENALARSLSAGWEVHGCVPAPLRPRPPDLRGYAALKHLWEQVLVPLAEWMAPTVSAAVRRSRPDVVIADQQALAGALIAERAGIPWVTSATTSSELVDPLSAMPRVRDWLTGLLTSLRRRCGDPAAEGDLRFSPHRVIAFTTEALAGTVSGPVTWVGPILRSSIVDGGFPWDRLDPARATVLVTMGTANSGVTADFLRECAAAVRDRPRIQGVVADPADSLWDHAGGLLRAAWLPQQALMSHAAAVICHAGHNTVCEALAHGVPLVLAPIRDDQPIVAEQVAMAGAGVRLRFGHARADHVGRALDRVLTEPSFTASARRIADSFAAAGGASAAADALAEVATS